MQEETPGSHYAHIRDPLLGQMLLQWVHYKNRGIMILTSRFPFPQLDRYMGVGYHGLELPSLQPLEGADLLQRLGVRGEDALLIHYVEKLHGHPLALKVLAATVKRRCYGDLTQFRGETILGDKEDDELCEKIIRLLEFYEKGLKGGQRELLGIVGLFKRPVEKRSFVTLLGTMKSLEKSPLAGAGEEEVGQELRSLTEDFLIEETREGITCHPVIRDHFRKGPALSGSRREVAGFLQGHPGGNCPETLEEVRDLVEAVQLLCDEGDYKTALDLEESRLSEGKSGFNVFRDFPAPLEGLDCSLAFVGDEERRKNMEALLGTSTLATYLSGVSFYNYLLGNLNQALEWWQKTLEVCHAFGEKDSQAIALQEISNIHCVSGRIEEAGKIVVRAISLSHEINDLENLRSGYTRKAYYDFLMGNSAEAFQGFETALLHEQKRKPDELFLYAMDGIRQGEFLIRIQAWHLFEEVNEWNFQNCTEYNWKSDLALCHLLQGWYETMRGRLSPAGLALTRAEQTLRPSGIPEYISRLDWLRAMLCEVEGDSGEGLRRVEESLLLCATKGFHLLHADGLVLRGRLRLMQFDRKGEYEAAERAGDDGKAALEIADRTGYAWAKMEALELLSSYNLKRGRKQEAQALRKRSSLTKSEMKTLKPKARQEFSNG